MKGPQRIRQFFEEWAWGQLLTSLFFGGVLATLVCELWSGLTSYWTQSPGLTRVFIAASLLAGSTWVVSVPIKWVYTLLRPFNVTVEVGNSIKLRVTSRRYADALIELESITALHDGDSDERPMPLAWHLCDDGRQEFDRGQTRFIDLGAPMLLAGASTKTRPEYHILNRQKPSHRGSIGALVENEDGGAIASWNVDLAIRARYRKPYTFQVRVDAVWGEGFRDSFDPAKDPAPQPKIEAQVVT